MGLKLTGYLDVPNASSSEACMSVGLDFLFKMMKASKSEQLVMLEENRTEEYTFRTACLTARTQDYPSPTLADGQWVVGTSLPFISDEDGPNAAWVWANRGKVEFEYFLESTEPLRDWGYVMWDKKRLDERGDLQESERPDQM